MHFTAYVLQIKLNNSVVLPYFGNPHYRYEVLPMGLAISPQVWITYIENLLKKTAKETYSSTYKSGILTHP